MVLRLCQLKSLFLITTLLIQSCAWKKNQEALEAPRTLSPKWFSTNERHSLHNQEGKVLPHLFYDISPDLNEKEQSVNVVITTPKNSPYGYSIDLSSGQRHFSHAYCPREDVWKNYPKNLDRPPFSMGLIPKALDQLGEPQKIIVWSRRKDFSSGYETRFFPVRIVGGYINQICPVGNCLGKSNWLSQLVFLGIDAEDPKSTEVTGLEEFRKHFDWEEARAYLGNLDGLNSLDQRYPSTKVGQLINAKDAFEYFKKRSIFLNDGELIKIQKGCHKLYDGLWEEVGKIQPEDRPARTREELKAKMKLIQELKKNQAPVGFSRRFKKFTKKFFKEVSTCERFVYHGNVNRDAQAFWFLSYAGLYFRLHRDGFYFDCTNRTWQRNNLTESGMSIYDIQKGIDSCDDEDLDQAMLLLPNFMTSLRGEKSYYKFLDYDNHEFGTHQKLYSWVKEKSVIYGCKIDPNPLIIEKTKVFPEDVSWEKRKVKDLTEKLKIIL